MLKLKIGAMAVRSVLAQRDRGILEQKFVKQVLRHEGQELVRAHQREISSRLDQHTGKTLRTLRSWVHSNANASGELNVQHLKRQRFLDMKTRTNKAGQKVRKKQFSIHNRIVFGHLNNIIRQLKFGFTEAIQEQLKQDQKIEFDV